MVEVSRLSDPEIARALAGVPGWHRQGDAIVRTFTFGGFREAVGFVNRVAELAERANHHPDILIQYRRVTLTLSTHSAGGLTSKDFELAEAIDRLEAGAAPDR